MSNQIPETQYDRLLYALGLEQIGKYYRTFFTQASDMLEVRMSQLSDCIRRGQIVTGPVLDAAKVKCSKRQNNFHGPSALKAPAGFLFFGGVMEHSTYCSAEITELARAMLKVQADLQPALKDRENTFSHSRYATLN